MSELAFHPSDTKSIGKGVSLVAQPIAGAQQEGAKGFFKGLATGIASAVALPVTGVCIGAYQVARGVGNQKQANDAAKKGMQWNDEKKEWVFYFLDEEQNKEIEKWESDKISGKSGRVGGVLNEKKVKDKESYDLQGISTSATSGEIK